MGLLGKKAPQEVPLKNEPYITLSLALERGDFSRWLDAMERLSGLLGEPFNFGHDFRGGGLFAGGRTFQGEDALFRLREKPDPRTGVLTLARTDPSHARRGYDWVSRFYRILATMDRDALGEGSWRSILSLPEALAGSFDRAALLELAAGGSRVLSGEIFRLPLGEGPLFCAVESREDREALLEAYPGYRLLEEVGPGPHAGPSQTPAAPAPGEGNL